MRKSASALCCGHTANPSAPGTSTSSRTVSGALTDGLEVCSQIKATEDARNTAVIAITAYHSPKAEREILKCGARVCLGKPLKYEVLLRELESALPAR